ncbi:hypothetical protein [Streptomyces sp. NPDC059009]
MLSMVNGDGTVPNGAPIGEIVSAGARSGRGHLVERAEAATA